MPRVRRELRVEDRPSLLLETSPAGPLASLAGRLPPADLVPLARRVTSLVRGLHGRGGRVGGAGCRGVRRGGASGARGGRRGAPRWRALLPRPHCLPAVPLRRRVRAGARAGALGRARGLWGLRLPGVGRGGPRRCERAGGRRLQRLVCCVFFPWGRAFVEDCHSPGGSSFLQCTSVTVVRGPGVGRSRHALDLRGSGRLLPWEM